jgi:hypothetical protein
MSARPCPRRFEVEAERDGRLTGRARVSLELHLSTCADCRAEAHALKSLASALAALPVSEADDVSARRQRHRLLVAFNDSQLASRGHGTTWRWAGAGLVAAAVASVAVVVGTRTHERGPVSTSPSGAPEASSVTDPEDPVVIVAADARWTRSEQGATTRVELDDGDIDIHVQHRGAPHGLVVSLPDGELDDVGTTFHVRVQDGRTVAIHVREGAVVFRRPGKGALLLGAGESWTGDGPPAPVVATPSASSFASAPAPSQPSPRARAPAAAKEDPDATSADREFRDAVASLNAGDGAGAAAAFRAYLARHPGDGRAEDAAYLLVLALRRSGDEAGAAAAARDYLQRYPQGFRRPEIERVAPSASAGR